MNVLRHCIKSLSNAALPCLTMDMLRPRSISQMPALLLCAQTHSSSRYRESEKALQAVHLASCKTNKDCQTGLRCSCSEMLRCSTRTYNSGLRRVPAHLGSFAANFQHATAWLGRWPGSHQHSFAVDNSFRWMSNRLQWNLANCLGQTICRSLLVAFICLVQGSSWLSLDRTGAQRCVMSSFQGSNLQRDRGSAEPVPSSPDRQQPIAKGPDQNDPHSNWGPVQSG